MKKSFLFFLVISLVTIAVSAQTVSISGTQKVSATAADKALESTPVTISEVMVVHQVVCDGAGFWIANKGGVIARFPDAPDAIGYVLKPGVYMAYPNLIEGQAIAKVEVRLVPQPASK